MVNKDLEEGEDNIQAFAWRQW